MKLGLLPKLIIGLIVGIAVGKLGMIIPIRILVTFGDIFGNFLKFVIPLIIIGFVAPGIGDLGKGAGKLLGITTGIAYLSTILAGTFAYFVNRTLSGNFLKIGELAGKIANPEHGLLKGFFTIDMPPIMGVMTALLIAFVLGIGISIVKGTAIKEVMGEFQVIVEKLIGNIVIPLLPLYIAAVFSNMTYAGQVESTMGIFAKVFLVIICLHLIMLLGQYTIAGVISNANPIFSSYNTSNSSSNKSKWS